jgi:hypothetical protein
VSTKRRQDHWVSSSRSKITMRTTAFGGIADVTGGSYWSKRPLTNNTYLLASALRLVHLTTVAGQYGHSHEPPVRSPWVKHCSWLDLPTASVRGFDHTVTRLSVDSSVPDAKSRVRRSFSPAALVMILESAHSVVQPWSHPVSTPQTPSRSMTSPSGTVAFHCTPWV